MVVLEVGDFNQKRRSLLSVDDNAHTDKTATFSVCGALEKTRTDYKRVTYLEDACTGLNEGLSGLEQTKHLNK